MTEVRALALKVFGKTNGSSVYELLRTDWNRYGLDLVKGDTLAQKLVVPLVEKWGKINFSNWTGKNGETGVSHVKGREIVSELMHENLGAKIRKS